MSKLKKRLEQSSARRRKAFHQLSQAAQRLCADCPEEPGESMKQAREEERPKRRTSKALAWLGLFSLIGS